MSGTFGHLSIVVLWEAFRWFVNAMEVIAVIAAILVTGLICAVVPLWMLGKLVGPPAGLGPDPDEIESGVAGNVKPILPGDAISVPRSMKGIRH